jgi:endopeptidase Clp ATP-binding regulatory subunit ClpX
MKDDDDPSEELRRAQEQMKQLFQGFKIDDPFADPDDDEFEEPPEDDEDLLETIAAFSFKPREIRDYLDRFVIQQDEAKKVLAVAICDHYNHVRQCLEKPELLDSDYAKQNIVLLGPTGVGKTYLMRCIARLIGVPFVKADATKFSETGYVGYDVDDIVRDLVRTADGDVDLAQYGIIYIDEIDKIAGRGGSTGKDVSGRGVQINLLKLMEETEVSLHSQTDMIGQMESMMEMMHGGRKRARSINTRHMLFIVSGAFDKLDDMIQQRMKGSQIGFTRQQSSDDDLENNCLRFVETRDLIKYGFEPEFVGRLPVRVSCNALEADDLRQILLESEGSILTQYRRDFEGYGIEFDLKDAAIDQITEQAAAERTGARGLMTVLERLFRDFKFELPSTSVSSFSVTADTVEDPQGTLTALLEDSRSEQRDVLRADVQRFADRFAAEHEFTLNFSKDAVKRLVTESEKSGKTVRAICEDVFRDLHFGLELVERNNGRSEFEISTAVIDDPEAALAGWLKG